MNGPIRGTGGAVAGEGRRDPRQRLLLEASRHPLASACAEGLARCGTHANGRLALLVSGGGDSMALLVLMASLRERVDPSLDSLAVLTVDHGLRAEAAEECARATALADRLGIARHETVRVAVARDGNLLDRARAARYAAAQAFVARHGCVAAVAAHTADDRAESLVLGLRRGLGVAALTRILPVREFTDAAFPMILRPLLAVRRRELREFLTDLGIDWSEDPSNALHDRGALRSDPSLAALVEAIAAGASRLIEEAAELERFRDDEVARRVGASVTAIARAEIDGFPAALQPAAIRLIVRRAGGSIAAATLDRAVASLRSDDRSPRSFEITGSVELRIDARSVSARSLR